jgi:hypothetical protein
MEIFDSRTEKESYEEDAEYKRRILAGLIGNTGLAMQKEDGKFGECPFCKKIGFIVKRRLNTAYYEEESNWVNSCYDCFLEDIEYYKEQWDEYYSNCM